MKRTGFKVVAVIVVVHAVVNLDDIVVAVVVVVIIVGPGNLTLKYGQNQVNNRLDTAGYSDTFKAITEKPFKIKLNEKLLPS